MNSNLNRQEWEKVAHEIEELQDMLWHSARNLSKFDLYEEKEADWTDDQCERYMNESYEFHLEDGWKRLQFIKQTLKKLGMPQDIEIKDAQHKVAVNF